jgi:hypothetical protein
MSKVVSLKLTRTHSASVPSALRYEMVATIVVAVVPVRGETSSPNSRLGPLEARTGSTVDASRMAAAHRALIQDHEWLPRLRRSMASTLRASSAGRH